MIWTILSWLMSGIALGGTLMNAERNKWGFAFWLISNLYMTVRFAVIGEYAQSTLFFIYFLLAIRGIISWTKKESKEQQSAMVHKSTMRDKFVGFLDKY